MGFKSFLAALMIFASIDLIVTAVAVVSATPEEAQGALRPINSIAPKLVQLASLGLIVGAASIVLLEGFSKELILSGVVLTPLLDIDHLPIAVGIPQPIRPSHSLLFIAMAALVIYLSLRRSDLALMASSSTMMHLAVDASSFPLLSPLTLTLYNTGTAGDLGMVAAAVSTALLSGYAARRAKYSGLERPVDTGASAKSI